MVYSPREDSYLLEKQVKKYSRNKSVIDIGTGSGIQALAAKNSEAKQVLASDIAKDSIEYVNSIGIRCVNSDLFKKIKKKFDLIIFNPPYLPLDLLEDQDSRKATTGGKKGDEIILRFLKQAKFHLNKNGIILLLISSLTPREKILSLLEKISLKYRVLSSEKFFFEEIEVWEIKA